MDSSSPTTGRATAAGDGGFASQALSFSDADRARLINVVQYILMVAIPIATLDMGLSYLFHDDNMKAATSPELLGGMIAELMLAALGLFVIHKVAKVMPTWTGVPIGPLNLFNMVTGLLLAKFTYSYDMLGKASILMGRIGHALGDTVEPAAAPKNEPSKHGGAHGGPPPRHAPARHHGSRSDHFYDSGGSQAPSYQAMAQGGPSPPPPQQRGPPPPQATQVAQEPPAATSSSLYGGPKTPLEQAQTPGVREPMAANEVLGGGSFASW